MGIRPGTLKVVVYKNGKKWAEDTVRTTGPAARLKLTPERPAIAGDGKDLAYVKVAVTDKDGLTVPTADDRVKFTVEGHGEIVAVGNGDATNHESFVAHQHKAFNGLCLVILRAKRPTRRLGHHRHDQAQGRRGPRPGRDHRPGQVAGRAGETVPTETKAIDLSCR